MAVDIEQLLDQELGKQPQQLDLDKLMDDELNQSSVTTPPVNPRANAASKRGARQMQARDNMVQGAKEFAFDSADLAVAMLGGSGVAEAVGAGVENPVSVATRGEEVKPIKSLPQDVKEGNFLDAGLKTVGLAGDALQLGGAYTAATGAGALPGAVMFGAGTALKFGAKAVSKYGDEISTGLSKLFDLDKEAAEAAAKRVDQFADDDKPIGAALSMLAAETKKARKASAAPTQSLVKKPKRQFQTVTMDESGLFSRVEDAITDRPDQLMTAQDWIKHFNDRGIQKEELEYALPSLFRTEGGEFNFNQDKMDLSKQTTRPVEEGEFNDADLLAEFKTNRIKIKETELSDKKPVILEPGQTTEEFIKEQLALGGSPEEITERLLQRGQPEEPTQYGGLGLVVADSRVTNREIAKSPVHNYREFPVQYVGSPKSSMVSGEIDQDLADRIDAARQFTEEHYELVNEIDEDIASIVGMKRRSLEAAGVETGDADQFFMDWANHHFFEEGEDYGLYDTRVASRGNAGFEFFTDILMDADAFVNYAERVDEGTSEVLRKLKAALIDMDTLPTQAQTITDELDNLTQTNLSARADMEAVIRTRFPTVTDRNLDAIRDGALEDWVEIADGDASSINYAAPHFDGEFGKGNFSQNLLGHYRTTDRTINDGKQKILFVEEMQSDAFGGSASDMPGSIPGKDNNYQRMILGLAMRRAVTEGYDGIGFASARQVRNVNGRAVFSVYDNVDVTTRSGEKTVQFVKNSTREGMFRVDPPSTENLERTSEEALEWFRKAIRAGENKVVKLRNKEASGQAPNYAIFNKDGFFLGGTDPNIFGAAKQLQDESGELVHVSQLLGPAMGGEIMSKRRVKMDVRFKFDAPVDDGYTTLYDKALPKRVNEFVNRLPIDDKPKIEQTTLDNVKEQVPSNVLMFNNEMTEFITQKGAPMMRKGGLAGRR